MARNNELGLVELQAASKFLISKGDVVMDMNWRVSKLKIDIMAQEPTSNLLYIAEVKG